MEKLAEAIQKAVTFCDEIKFKREPMYIDIIITGKSGIVKNVWLPESDHLDKMAHYISMIVNDIYKLEKEKKDDTDKDNIRN